MATKINKKNLTTIYFLRHGQTDWNVNKILQGHKDIPLNQTGLDQARSVAKKLKHIPFAAIYSSDLLRAKQTAMVIALQHQLTVKTLQILREKSYGRFEGRTVAEFRREMKTLLAQYEQLSDRDQFKFKFSSLPDNWDDVISRVISFLKKIALTYPGKNVLVVSHGGILRHLLVHLGFATLKQLYLGTIKNTAFAKLQSDGVEFFVKSTSGILLNEN